MPCTIKSLSNAVGCEVIGVDLKFAASTDIELIIKALNEKLVSVIRNQILSPSELVEVARQFGNLAPQHMSNLMLKDEPAICEINSAHAAIDADGKPKLIGEGNWHVDHTNLERPPKYTILYAKKLPSKGGDTGFADMQKAFASLSKAEQKKLIGLKSYNGLLSKPEHTSESDLKKYGATKVHPFSRTQPETGKKSIYCHPQKLAFLGGMSPEASQDLILKLQAKTINENNTYRHKWRLGDLIIWDNRGVMHKAFYDYDHKEERIMHRVLIEGEVPF